MPLSHREGEGNYAAGSEPAEDWRNKQRGASQCQQHDCMRLVDTIGRYGEGLRTVCQDGTPRVEGLTGTGVWYVSAQSGCPHRVDLRFQL